MQKAKLDKEKLEKAKIDKEIADRAAAEALKLRKFAEENKLRLDAEKKQKDKEAKDALVAANELKRKLKEKADAVDAAVLKEKKRKEAADKAAAELLEAEKQKKKYNDELSRKDFEAAKAKNKKIADDLLAQQKKVDKLVADEKKRNEEYKVAKEKAKREKEQADKAKADKAKADKILKDAKDSKAKADKEAEIKAAATKAAKDAKDAQDRSNKLAKELEAAAKVRKDAAEAAKKEAARKAAADAELAKKAAAEKIAKEAKDRANKIAKDAKDAKDAADREKAKKDKEAKDAKDRAAKALAEKASKDKADKEAKAKLELDKKNKELIAAAAKAAEDKKAADKKAADAKAAKEAADKASKDAAAKVAADKAAKAEAERKAKIAAEKAAAEKAAKLEAERKAKAAADKAAAEKAAKIIAEAAAKAAKEAQARADREAKAAAEKAAAIKAAADRATAEAKAAREKAMNTWISNDCSKSFPPVIDVWQLGKKFDNITHNGDYKLSFKIKPNGLVGNWGSILHLTKGGDCCGQGQRSPALWFFPNSTKFYIILGDDGGGDWGLRPETIGASDAELTAPIGQVSTFELTCVGSDITLTVNGKTWKVKQPSKRASGTFNVYASSPWYGTPNATVTDLCFVPNYVDKNVNIFNPKSIEGLQLWFDADDVNGTGSNPSGSIKTWVDKSGGNNNLTTRYQQPSIIPNSINGKSTVLFENNKNLDGKIRINNDKLAIYSVIKTRNGGGFAARIIGFAPGDGRNDFDTPESMGLLRQHGISYGPYRQGSYNSNDIPPNQPTILSAWYDGNKQYSNVNGSFSIKENHRGGNFNINVFSVGKQPNMGDIGASQYDGEIAEILVYKSNLSKEDHQKVEGYLAWKWGIQGNLPANHTFKNAAPGGSGKAEGFDPISYLPLVENYKDMGLKPQNVQTSGPVQYTTVNGRKCAYFSNRGDTYLRVPNTTTTKFTISFWFLIKSGQYYTMVSRSNDGWDPRLQVDLQLPGTLLLALGLPNPWTVLRSTTRLEQNNWYNMTLTIDGVNAQLFINGVFEGKAQGSSPMEDRPYWVLGRSGDNGRAADVCLAHFAVWDKVISSQEIEKYYNATKSDSLVSIGTSGKSSGGKTVPNVSFITVGGHDCVMMSQLVGIDANGNNVTVRRPTSGAANYGDVSSRAVDGNERVREHPDIYHSREGAYDVWEVKLDRPTEMAKVTYYDRVGGGYRKKENNINFLDANRKILWSSGKLNAEPVQTVNVADGKLWDDRTGKCIRAVEDTGFIPVITWANTPGEDRHAICDDLLCPYFKSKYGSYDNMPGKYVAIRDKCKRNFP